MHRILYFGFLLATACLASAEELEKGGCVCALFPGDLSEPLIEHPLPFNAVDDEEGANKCEQLCVALAHCGEDTAAVICKMLNRDVENLKVSLYTRYDTTPWKFSGLKSTDPICCCKGEPTACNETALATKT